MPSWRASVISRTTPLYCRITFAVSNCATLVWATVRTLLFAPPYASTSLNAAAHSGLESDGGGRRSVLRHPERRFERLIATVDRDDGVVHRGRLVRHVEVPLVLERARADDRVLGNLVPLLNRIARRQSARSVALATSRSAN